MSDTATGKSKQGDHAALLSCTTVWFDFPGLIFRSNISLHFIITACSSLPLAGGLQHCTPLSTETESVIDWVFAHHVKNTHFGTTSSPLPAFSIASAYDMPE